MWLWIVLALLLLVIGVLWLARKSFRARVRQEFIAFMREAKPELEVVAQAETYLQLRGNGEDRGQLFLYKLFGAIASLPLDTPEARREIFQHFLSSVMELSEEGLKDLSVAQHGERIMPRLVPPGFFARLPPDADLPRTPMPGTGLYVVYVLDAPNSVMYITGKQAQDLDLDLAALHELALENLGHTVSEDSVRQVIDGNTLSMFKALDSFDAARILLVPRLLGEGETVVALIPDRDTLALAPLPSDNDWTGLKELARTPGGDHLLLDRPVKVTCHGFEVI